MIPLYTLYTPSHAPLKERFFEPSVPEGLELRLHFLENAGPGCYHDSSWCRAIVRKVEVILRAIHECWGGVFVWSDIDVQFFAPFNDWVRKTTRAHDLVFQVDAPGPALCDGFFFCRGTPATLRLWEDVMEFIKTPDSRGDDQLGVQKFAGQRPELRMGFLPPLFMGGGTFTGRGWNPGDPLIVTEGLVAHHANFTIGVGNKIKQCELVRRLVRRGDGIALADACERIGPAEFFQYD